MLFDPYANVAASVRPAGNHLRRSVAAWPTTVLRDGTTTKLVSVKAHQPDDRPRQPKTGADWIEVHQTQVTARRNEKPKHWDGIVASFDDGTPKAPVTSRMGVRAPIVRAHTGSKSQSAAATDLRASEMRSRIDAEYLNRHGKDARR